MSLKELDKKELYVLRECLTHIWDCWNDVPFFEGEDVNIQGKLLKEINELLGED